MDRSKLLKTINTLSEYISASRDMADNKNIKVQFNMSIVLALKKIMSYEVEYFNKYEENGIACAAFQYIVDLAPSKTWGVLGKEIVNLIQYWLDAIRKHLITHSLHWWMFLKLLLTSIKEVRLKDSSLPNLLVEHTAECLLDLATNDRADVYQKYEILHCLNMYCAESNREIRFALRNKLGEYFAKLSAYISSCGYFPCQLSVMETLLRWLVPRHDQILRANSADKWFPSTLYSRDAVDVFLNRPWMDFFQDARDFLNIHNRANNLIVSVICRSLSIGQIVIIPGKAKHTSWLDINSKGKCLSVVLDPQMLESFGATNLKSWETFLISEDNTQAAKLAKESHQLTISVTTVRPPQAHPSLIKITNESTKDVKIVLSSKSDSNELDTALRGVFGNKYQLLMNLDSQVTESSSDTRKNCNSDEESRFSHPVAVRRSRHAGYIVRSRNLWKSPSTTSTTSLAQLHDRLAALPTYTYDKESVRVCASPKLSKITEVCETDDQHSLISATTTHKILRSCGVCYSGTKGAKNDTGSPQRNEFKKPSRGLSPVIGTNTTASCLLVATIGSTDDSVISNTMERIAKNKDFEPDNIVDLLVKEALEASIEEPIDSGINTCENRKTDQEEAIENTPYADELANVTLKRGCTVVRESTSDESNTEVISGTPLKSINTRLNKNDLKKSKEECSKEIKSNFYDAQVVEEFFSQHFSENSAGNITISPTLAKKINESSSETSEYFDERIIVDIHENLQEFDNDKSDVIECLNYMVEKVCEDLDKYTDNLNIDNDLCNFITDVQEPLEIAMEGEDNFLKRESLTTHISDPEPTKSLKLKYIISPKIKRTNKNITATKKRKNTTKKYENALRKELIVQPKQDEQVISPKIIKKRTKPKLHRKSKQSLKPTTEINLLENTNTERDVEKENVSQNDKEEKLITKPDLINDIVLDTSMTRRKRKLYSPKDDRINNQRNLSEEDDKVIEFDTSSNVMERKSSTIFYKEIEKERKKYNRKSRTRKTKIQDYASPRTLKMNQVFDKLKETVESNEKITLADKTYEIDVYNFTSDSEEEYFKKKKILTHKRPSTTTLASFESAISTRRGRVTKKVNYTENKSNDESSKQNSKRKRVAKKQKTKKRKVSVESVIELEDERMRQAPPEILNTSITIDNPKEKIYAEIEPVLTRLPELESIVNVEQSTKEKNKSVTRHKKIELSLKKGETKTNSIDVTLRNESTDSPLPGLVVESAMACMDDNNDSVTATMLQKFKKIYQDGFDTYVNETNTTHNLLSDVDRLNNSPHSSRVQEDYIQTDNCVDLEGVHNKKQISRNKKLKKTTSTKYNSTNNTLLINYENRSYETVDNKSEVSIATQGINAHGEMDEAPPSPAMIEQQVQPRNLEFDDLAQSMKEFFDNLRNQITGSDIKTHENLDHSCQTVYFKPANIHSENSKVNKKSMDVETRLSSDEIDEWVSLRKNNPAKISQKAEKPPKHYKPSIIKRKKSPVVSVSRLSSSEIQKWIPSCNNSVAQQDNTKVQDKSKESKGLQSLYDDHKWFPSRRNSSSDVESETNNQNETKKLMIKHFRENETLPNVSVSSSNGITTRSKRSNNEDASQKDNRMKLKSLYNNIANLKNILNENGDTNDNKDNTIKYSSLNETICRNPIEQSEAIQKRSSVISPIKLDNFISHTKKSKSQSDEDEYIQRVKNIFTESERISTKQRKLESKTSQNYLDVMSSPNSTSTKINSSTKRKSSPIGADIKRQKIEVVHSATISDAGPSTSSVNEWFKRNEPSYSKDAITQLSVIDCVQNVVEKLDTTLVDMNQNTSRQLINLFADAQKQLDEHRERRRALYKQAASDMLSKIVKIMDEKFCDLDNRSQEMDDIFMEQLRNRASQKILEDSKQKQVMVQIMKEDVQAVADYIKNKVDI